MMKVDSSSTRRWYKLCASSWFILGLTIIVLIAMNLPYEYAPPHPGSGSSGGLVVLFPFGGGDGHETERMYGGWPLRYLSVRSGEYFDAPEYAWSILAMAGDLLVAVLLGALVVAAYEQRRRRRTRRWQLTLSDLCFLMLFVCGVLGTWSIMAQRYLTQENAIFQLSIEGGEATKRLVLPTPIIGPSLPSPLRGQFHARLIDQLWNHERPHSARLRNLTDESMSALRQLSEIETLVVQNPNVTDDDAIAVLESLRLKDLPKLSSNLFVTSSEPLVVEAVNLPSLTSIDLRYQCLERMALEHLPVLHQLDLTGSSADDSMLSGLDRLTSLQTLVLRDTDITDTTMSRIVDFHQLDRLDLENTAITDAGLAALSPRLPLTVLNLTRTDVSDRGLLHLAGQQQLSALYLGATHVRGPGLHHLSNIVTLQQLSLGDTNVTSDGLAHLQNLENLQWLRLSDTKIDDNSFQHLNRQTNLRHLFLNGTSVTDTGIATFGLPRALRELDISNTGVTAEGVTKLKGRVKVSWLKVAW